MNKSEIEAKIHEALHSLTETLGLSVVPRPVITWDLRGKSTLGQAFGHAKIRLHVEALDKLGDEYVQTALHEACHIAVNALKAERCIYSREGEWSSHGRIWKSAMRSLGLQPDRCATLPAGVTLTPARRTVRYVAKCACRDHWVTKGQANHIGSFVCRSCKSRLILVGRA